MIDIGNEAIDREYTLSPKTWVVKNNPANAPGRITSVEIWANTELTGCKVATFYVVSGNNLSTRDYETIQIDGQDPGVVPAGSKQTATVNLDVEEGDCLGIYFSAGLLDRDNEGIQNNWNATGDNIPCTNQAFTLASYYLMSLYGTGIFALSIGGTLDFSGTVNKLTKKALLGVLSFTGSLTVLIYYAWVKAIKTIGSWTGVSKETGTFTKVNKDKDNWNKVDK